MAGSFWWAYRVRLRSPSDHMEMIGVILRSIPVISFRLNVVMGMLLRITPIFPMWSEGDLSSTQYAHQKLSASTQC